MAKTKSKRQKISQEEKAKRARFLAKCKKRRDEFRGKMQDAETIVLAAAEREKKQKREFGTAEACYEAG